VSLKLRLFGLVVVLFAVAITVAGAVLPHLVRGYLVERVDEKLPSVGLAVLARLVNLPQPDRSDLADDAFFLLDGAYVMIVDQQGVVRFEGFLDESDEVLQAPDLAGLADASVEQPITVEGHGSGVTTRYRAARIDPPLPDEFGDLPIRPEELGDLDDLAVIAALPLTDAEATIDRIVAVELALGASLLAVLAVATWWVVGVGLRPLTRMEEVAKSLTSAGFESGRPVGRIEHPSTRTEIGQLGATLNELLDEIDDALTRRAATEDRLRRFVADASHELRTPLTSIRGYAQLLLRHEQDPTLIASHLHRIDSESARMSALVDDLLNLARIDDGTRLHVESLDVTALLRNVAADARAVDPQRTITVTGPSTVLASANRSALEQMLVNLVANARLHTPAGTSIELGASVIDPMSVAIDVVDHGPGIAHEFRGSVFERFARLDAARARSTGGTGLGLSIVATLAEHQGGTVDIRDTPGGGATFTITLPSTMVDVVSPTT
jgi:two-component system, OmpR family, sensor kinase